VLLQKCPARAHAEHPFRRSTCSSHVYRRKWYQRTCPDLSAKDICTKARTFSTGKTRLASARNSPVADQSAGRATIQIRFTIDACDVGRDRAPHGAHWSWCRSSVCRERCLSRRSESNRARSRHRTSDRWLHRRVVAARGQSIRLARSRLVCTGKASPPVRRICIEPRRAATRR
jgi:hypothetical protein